MSFRATSQSPSNMQTHYKTLGIQSNASIDDIRKAYRQLALKLHPDKQPDGNDNEFKKIQDAYSILSDENSRREYDTKLYSLPTPKFHHEHINISEYHQASFNGNHFASFMPGIFSHDPFSDFFSPIHGDHFGHINFNSFMTRHVNPSAFLHKTYINTSMKKNRNIFYQRYTTRLKSEPFPISKRVICDLDNAELETYFIEIQWSDGSISFEPI